MQTRSYKRIAQNYRLFINAKRPKRLFKALLREEFWGSPWPLKFWLVADGGLQQASRTMQVVTTLNNFIEDLYDVSNVAGRLHALAAPAYLEDRKGASDTLVEACPSRMRAVQRHVRNRVDTYALRT